MFTPNDDIMESRRTISRRRALGVGGTVGLAGLIAACAPGTKTTNTAASTSTSAFATSTTSVAAAAVNEQKLRELLNAAPGCVTTPEETQGPYYFDVDHPQQYHRGPPWSATGAYDSGAERGGLRGGIER